MLREGLLDELAALLAACAFGAGKGDHFYIRRSNIAGNGSNIPSQMAEVRTAAADIKAGFDELLAQQALGEPQPFDMMFGQGLFETQAAKGGDFSNQMYCMIAENLTCVDACHNALTAHLSPRPPPQVLDGGPVVRRAGRRPAVPRAHAARVGVRRVLRAHRPPRTAAQLELGSRPAVAHRTPPSQVKPYCYDAEPPLVGSNEQWSREHNRELEPALREFVQKGKTVRAASALCLCPCTCSHPPSLLQVAWGYAIAIRFKDGRWRGLERATKILNDELRCETFLNKYRGDPLTCCSSPPALPSADDRASAPAPTGELEADAARHLPPLPLPSPAPRAVAGKAAPRRARTHCSLTLPGSHYTSYTDGSVGVSSFLNY